MSQEMLQFGICLLVGIYLCSPVQGQEDKLTQCLSENAGHCMTMALEMPGEEQLSVSDLFRISFWKRFCNQTEELLQCVSDVCPASGVAIEIALTYTNYRPVIPSAKELNELRQTVCEGASVRESVLLRYQKAGDLQCVGIRMDEVKACVRGFLDESADISGQWNSLDPIRRESLVRYGKAMFQCALTVVMTNCTEEARTALKYVLNMTVPLNMRYNFHMDKMYNLNHKDIMSVNRSTVGVFGDPHLLMYGVTSPVTCTTPGSRVLYLYNAMVNITGTNHVIDQETGATVLKRVEIKFFSSDLLIGSYMASNNKLPMTFTNRDSTIYPSYKPIVITRQTDDLVLINSTDRALTIMVERHQEQYLFSVRLGYGMLEASSGLLVTGCSLKNQHLININEHLENDSRRLRRSTDNCHATCQELNSLPGPNITDNCMFDCQITGSTKYAETGKKFLEQLNILEEIDATLPLIESVVVDDQPIVSAGLMTSLHALCAVVWLSMLLAGKAHL